MEGVTRLEAEARLIDKSFEDETFKRELIANPKEILQKEFGVELPVDLKVDVLEALPQKSFIVIPMKPPGDVSLPEVSEAKTGGDEVILKAWRDDAFKNDLLADSKGALKKEFGVELPDDLELVAVEETPNQLYIAIPKERAPNDELSDEQLETVAGGECLATSAAIWTCVGIGALVGGTAVVGAIGAGAGLIGGFLAGAGTEQARRAW